MLIKTAPPPYIEPSEESSGRYRKLNSLVDDLFTPELIEELGLPPSKETYVFPALDTQKGINPYLRQVDKKRTQDYIKQLEKAGITLEPRMEKGKLVGMTLKRPNRQDRNLYFNNDNSSGVNKLSTTSPDANLTPLANIQEALELYNSEPSIKAILEQSKNNTSNAHSNNTSNTNNSNNTSNANGVPLEDSLLMSILNNGMHPDVIDAYMKNLTGKTPQDLAATPNTPVDSPISTPAPASIASTATTKTANPSSTSLSSSGSVQQTLKKTSDAHQKLLDNWYANLNNYSPNAEQQSKANLEQAIKASEPEMNTDGLIMGSGWDGRLLSDGVYLPSPAQLLSQRISGYNFDPRYDAEDMGSTRQARQNLQDLIAQLNYRA